MEVAGQWRRQWAGTAEYGKVTEGGVTRQVARAMEVVQASAPGARVRVMRAAYHASAARGAPAASFLMHSSHSVISSGFNLLETPTFSAKPLEISSTPLESTPERNTGTENYKVTEPDDYEISEPSKWKSSAGRSSTRVSSEESSSTDNASIIDLDTRYKNFRKYSYDSENSDTPIFKRNSARMSPLLDEPVALSTLKYRSLLNGNNDWNNRRKSYSFENTALNDLLHSEDTLVLESSTDSGICKSTEIINDSGWDVKSNGYKCSTKKNSDCFVSWLSENRSGPFYNITKTEGVRGRNNTALHSAKKMTVTVPMTVAENYQPKVVTEEESRKLKKVGFSKTELHFIPDTGTVNIIDTDNKPPSSHDFRRRRTELLFLMNEKPITLLDNTSKELFEKNKRNASEKSTYSTRNEALNEFEEITAATKSILKNKIPIPKPYLLGENMELGSLEKSTIEKYLNYNTPASEGVSQINISNKQLHERGNDETSRLDVLIDPGYTSKAVWTTRLSPLSNLKKKKQLLESTNPTLTKNEYQDYNKVNPTTLYPARVETRAKTRQLRHSDLTYFGINNSSKTLKDVANRKDEVESFLKNSIANYYLQSVKLVKKISDASETESNEPPEYQNVSLITNIAPIPTPRPRSKFDTTYANPKNIEVSTNVFERNNNGTKESRQSRLTHTESINSNRSISAPPKIKPEKSKQTKHESSRLGRHHSPEDIRRSPERDHLSVGFAIRHSPEQIYGSPKQTRRHNPKVTSFARERARHSPESTRRTAPERARYSSEITRRPAQERARHSPENIRRPAQERARHSPENIRRPAQERAPHSPENIRRPAQERAPHSPENIRRPAQERAPHSPENIRRPAQERVPHSPENIRRPILEHVSRSPKNIRRSAPERACHSPENKFRPSPEHSRHFPEKTQDTEDTRQRSPERTTHSPENTCRLAPERVLHSPERALDSSDRVLKSSERIRLSPERFLPSQQRARVFQKRIHSSPEHAHHPSERIRRSPIHPEPIICSPKRTRPSPERPRHSPDKLRNRSPDYARRFPEQTERCSPERNVFKVEKLSNVDVKENDEPTYVNHNIPQNNGLRNYRGDKNIDKTGNKTESVIQKIRNFENRNQDVVRVTEKTVNTDDVVTQCFARLNTPVACERYVVRRNSESHKVVKPESTNGEVKNATVNVENNDAKCTEKNTRQKSRNSKQSKELIKQKSGNKHTPETENTESRNKHTPESKNTESRNKHTPESKNTESRNKHSPESKNTESRNKHTSESKNTESHRRPDLNKNGNSSSPQRSKYIINYDDKNGTVSSVCKVKHDNSLIKKKPIKEKYKEAPTEHKSKIKATEKIALLQSAENQWDPCELNCTDRKWKRKKHVQRSCQLL